LNGGPGAAARTKFSISLGPRATTPSQIIVVQWTWSRSRAKVFNHPGTWSLNPNPNYCCTVDLEPQTGQIFNLPGTWSLNPKPNYCCMRDLEPQPGITFQSPWYLEPQPQAKILLYWGPGAAAGPKFLITLGPRATTPSQIIFLQWTWSCRLAKLSIALGRGASTPSQIIFLRGTWSRSPAKIFNHPGTSSHNPKPNYCCTWYLEPQPGQNFQSPWDLEPQPRAKLLLYEGPGAAAHFT
jgi:hypothetical protein